MGFITVFHSGLVRPSLFFLCLPSNGFPDVGLVGQIEKKNLKKNHKKFRNSRLWYPRTTLKVNIHIFGLTKCTIYSEKCSCFCSCFLYALCCYYVKNGATMSLLFFFENAKNLGPSDDGKRRKRMALVKESQQLIIKFWHVSLTLFSS